MSILQVSEDRAASKRKNTSDTVVCTACYQRLDAYRVDWLKKHPVLKVLICKRCLMKHETPIQKGDDGMDEACRWCALEGDLICCDFCHNVFCNECIRRNLGRKHLNIILNAGPEQKWQCYVCNPDGIQGLIKMCQDTLSSNDNCDLEDLEDLEDEVGVEEGVVIEATPKKRKYTKRQPKIVPIEELTYEALIEKKVYKGDCESDKSSGVVGGLVEEDGSGVTGKDSTNDLSTPATPITSSTVPLETATSKPDGEFLYIETSDGKVVAMNRSDVIKVDKKPKGRPRLGTTQAPKKYPHAPEGNSPSSLEALASVKLHKKIPLMVSSNAWNVVEKMTASIQSMCMLLTSLKDDLVRTEVLCSKEGRDVRRKKKELAVNFWRAYLAYKKSFVDIEAYSHSAQSIVPSDSKNTSEQVSNMQEQADVSNTNGLESQVPEVQVDQVLQQQLQQQQIQQQELLQQQLQQQVQQQIQQQDQQMQQQIQQQEQLQQQIQQQEQLQKLQQEQHLQQHNQQLQQQ